MHIIHAYYEQCVFYRYKVCQIITEYFVTGYIMIAL